MVNGIIIENDYNKAETIKILLENSDASVKVKSDILDDGEESFTLLDISGYDFLMTHVKSINEYDLKRKIMPYLKLLSEKKSDYIVLHLTKKIVFLDKNEIVGIEVMVKDCYVYTRTGAYILGRITLKKLLEYLNDPNIVRCHKSYALNLKFVRGFKKETRTRWHPLFLVKTKFDCKVTDLFLDNVIKQFKANNNVETEDVFIAPK